MVKRIISGVVAGAVLVLLLIYSNVHVINICVGLVSIIGLTEIYRATKLDKNVPLMICGYIVSICFTYAQFFNNRLILPIIIAYIIVLFGIYLIYNDKIKFKNISEMFFITFYISFMFGTISYTRQLDNGKLLIWLIFITAFASDSFAYFVGSFFGKHKLAPTLSPNKTVEGSIGGILGSVLCCLIYGFVLQSAISIPVSYVNLGILGAIGALMGQFGDLAASRIKREFDIKDFGSIMPGHGGVLDRIDSVLFTAPIVFIFVSLVKVIG